MASAHVAVVERVIEECWNGARLDAVEDLFAPDCVTHTASRERPVLHGWEEERQAIRSLHATFSDLAFTIEGCLPAESSASPHAFCRWTATGTHIRSYLNVPPTGRRITWSGATLYRLAGERVVEEWWYVDRYGIFEQLIDSNVEQVHAREVG